MDVFDLLGSINASGYVRVSRKNTSNYYIVLMKKQKIIKSKVKIIILEIRII